MELRAFAEQVLFATSLDDKLHSPETITDDHPGTAMTAPTMPGRPGHLRFKETGEGGKSPRAKLAHEKDRGRLLHFFANHELLATELMALVLLRFPEAPASFRRGVWQTLRDEQEHTRLYLERMRACGVEFGDLPVSGYFWRAVSAMQNPIDYVAGLSLTFEQANLDFSRHFAGEFARVGDKTGAQLLERIYRDEIVHVAYGLKWFRRWKNPEESDWAAFCRHLQYPLSPQRAKGFAVNVEGRRAAGLEPEFIAELDVYSQSKGRTPAVYYFNPFAEGFIAHGAGFTPAKHQAQLARDLAALPQFLCRQDDVVLVPRRPSVNFLSALKRLGFTLPEFVELGERPHQAIAELRRRRLGLLRPWAWSPDSVQLLGPLEGAVTAERRSNAQRFNPRLAELYSKAWSADFLRAIVAEAGEPTWLCSGAQAGVATSSAAETLQAIAAIRACGHHRIVVKEAIGLAGSNALRLFEPTPLPSQLQWIQHRCGLGRGLVVEPWLERLLDFSVQLEMTPAGLRLCGFTTLLNDRNGQFLGNVAAPNHSRQLPPQIATALGQPLDVATRVPALFEQIRLRLERELRSRDFLGPLGIDALVYRSADGLCRLKPMVELNPRHTMGRLTLELMRFASPGRYGLFRLLNLRTVQAAGFADFAAWAQQQAVRLPVTVDGHPVPRIQEGLVCLNDPAEARACLAVFAVTPHRPESGLLSQDFAL
jgi:uncharacterized ferritin-like protein (DUF455 family)